MDRYLAATPLLDFHHPKLQQLIAEQGWRALSRPEQIRSIYDYVQNRVVFGYNISDDIPASRVLRDGYGQCNTKATLFMALLRAVGIPCRFHGFTIDNALQKGAIPAYLHRLAPAEILHSWVEVYHDGKWINLEGIILDRQYLSSIQQMFAGHEGAFCGYGIATGDLAQPQVEWSGEDTYIQRDGITQDLGVHDAPDSFYREHGRNLSGVKRLLWRFGAQALVNRHVAQMRRRGALPVQPN